MNLKNCRRWSVAFTELVLDQTLPKDYFTNTVFLNLLNIRSIHLSLYHLEKVHELMSSVSVICILLGRLESPVVISRSNLKNNCKAMKQLYLKTYFPFLLTAFGQHSGSRRIPLSQKLAGLEAKILSKKDSMSSSDLNTVSPIEFLRDRNK